MDMRSLYLVKRESGVCVYHKDFGESVFDPHLLSSFIVAMTTFFDEATGSTTSRARAFEGTDYKIIVEFGEWILGALSVEKDSVAMRARLKRTVERFEDQFNLLRFVDLDLAIYSRFEPVVIEEFIRHMIHPESIIQVRRHWEFYTKNQQIVAFLRLIPRVCTVKDTAEFLEMPIEIAMNLVAEAIWEKVITITQPIRPEDIYQATALVGSHEAVDGVSPETARVLPQLDGETPLSIAAEKVRTKDLKMFLEEIAILAKQRAVEQISPSQAVVVLYSMALQAVLNRISMLLGFGAARRAFFDSREALVAEHPWLAFVSLEEGVDVEIKTSLTSATVKGQIDPDTLTEGFGRFFRLLAESIKEILGPRPVRAIIRHAKIELEKQFPSRTYQIEWERMAV